MTQADVEMPMEDQLQDALKARKEAMQRYREANQVASTNVEIAFLALLRQKLPDLGLYSTCPVTAESCNAEEERVRERWWVGYHEDAEADRRWEMWLRVPAAPTAARRNPPRHATISARGRTLEEATWALSVQPRLHPKGVYREAAALQLQALAALEAAIGKGP